MYPLFRDVAGPYQRALWVKYVLHTHIIAFIIKSNWKLSQNLHTWTTQYVHFQCGIYWPKPVVLASSSTSISSKWNILSEFFIFYTKASINALATILCPIMCGSKWPIFKVCKCDVNYDMVVPLIRIWRPGSCLEVSWIFKVTIFLSLCVCRQGIFHRANFANSKGSKH